jgi:hypothetical protein
MPPQRNQHYRPILDARANFDRLCKKHKAIPTPADVDAIRSVIGPVSGHATVQDSFEAALLFFLPRSAVEFEENSLLVGWRREHGGQVKQEVWYKKPPASRRGHFGCGPGGLLPLPYTFKSSVCTEWHPVMLDIVNPNQNKNHFVQSEYFRACIKVLQAAVPPPSIERSRSACRESTTASSTTFNPDGSQQETTTTPRVTPAPTARLISPIVDLTSSDEEVVIKREVTSDPAPNDPKQPQAPTTQVEDRIQAFRDKLDNKEVKELQQMLEKQLPSWIRELAEDVLQKKMLRELDLAESLFL